MCIASRRCSTTMAPACAATCRQSCSAILLDYEARSPSLVAQTTYGKQREPLLRVTHLARAFPAPSAIQGTYRQTTNQVITITTTSPHMLDSGDYAYLVFTDTSGQPTPSTQSYSVTAINANTLTITAPQLRWELTARPMERLRLPSPITALPPAIRFTSPSPPAAHPAVCSKWRA